MTDSGWQSALEQEPRVYILPRGADTDGRHSLVNAYMRAGMAPAEAASDG